MESHSKTTTLVSCEIIFLDQRLGQCLVCCARQFVVICKVKTCTVVTCNSATRIKNLKKRNNASEAKSQEI